MEGEPRISMKDDEDRLGRRSVAGGLNPGDRLAGRVRERFKPLCLRHLRKSGGCPGRGVIDEAALKAGKESDHENEDGQEKDGEPCHGPQP